MKNAEIEHKTDFDLISYNTLRLSSVADDVYFPSTIDEFTLLLANLDNPLVIGRGSNILLSSYGTKRPVIITKKLNRINVNSPCFEVEAGVSAPKVSQMALELKLTGFEFLTALPSTVGGAVCMNAGACGQTISDCFKQAKVYDSNEDAIKTFSCEDMDFSYRNSKLKNQERYFLLSAEFELKEGENYSSIQNLMNENIEKRKGIQPDLKSPNLGCVFKNPESEVSNLSAGRLLDECSLKSQPFGGAMVYHNHANFIINFNNATSLDYISLMEEMQKRVYEKFNIKLQPEIVYAGENKKEAEIWNRIIEK